MGSGKFDKLGTQVITLQGTGTPLSGGASSFIVTAGNYCNFILNVDSSSASFLNKAPVAHAGADTSILLPVNNVTVIGNGKDSDGVIASYQWKKVAGPPLSMVVNPNNAITAINNLEEGIYQFELTVTDNLGATGKDTLVIKVIQPSLSSRLFIEQELDATSPVNDTMNYISNNITNIISNYHLQRIVDYQNNKISQIDYWYHDASGDSIKTLTHNFFYDNAGNVSQIFETQISINTTFLHEEFSYNNDNTIHERKTHYLGGRILRDNIFLYTGGNLTTVINLTPDNMGAPDTTFIAYGSRINTFNKIAPQYYLLDLQSDYYLTFRSEIFYFSKNYPVSLGGSPVEVNTDPITENPLEIRVDNILLLRYIYK